MKDKINTEDQNGTATEVIGKPEPTARENDAAAADMNFNPDGSDGDHPTQPPPAEGADVTTLPYGAPDEIPGFLRRCAAETSAHEKALSAGGDYEESAGAGAGRPERASAFAEGIAASGPADPDGSDRSKYEPFRSGRGFPTGARLRGEVEPVTDQAAPQNPDWSNTARSALSELLTDIDSEQARRISNRDKFAALAGKRRTTWPLTALIVSFLFVVVAYSVRNVDAGDAPGKVLAQAWALVAGPQGGAGADPAPPASRSEPPVAMAPAPVPETRMADIQPAGQQKTTGLIYEPVKIVGPFGPVKPASRQIAAVKPAPVLPPSAATPPAGANPPAASKPALRAAPVVSANVGAVAPVKPVAAAPDPVSTTIALAPSTPISPDKMPLASLAISATDTEPGPEIAPRRFRQVASVAPGLIGGVARRQLDVPLVPPSAPAVTNKLAVATPQPMPEKAPVLQSSPATAVAVPDRYGTKSMLARAEKLLESRDVASARLLFERAASYGSADGAFGAAKTYDPVCFEKLGVYGVPAEPEKAAALYQIAIDAGHVKAVEYLNSLNALRRKMKLKASTAQR